MKLYLEKNQKVVINNVKVADTFIGRLNGLMFKKSIERDFALVISPCNSIHMFFMKFPLDVLFVDKNNKIVGVNKEIKPWRMSKLYPNASYVVEMSSGIIKEYEICIGDTIKIAG